MNNNSADSRQNGKMATLPPAPPIAAGSFTGASSSGRVRKLNEDAFYFDSSRGVEGNLFVLCDGMGGHKAGDVASKYAVKRINEYFYKSQNPDITLRLKESISKINSEIYIEANRDQAKSGMGTTLVAAFIVAGKIYIANVGDSRAYIFRDGKINKLTKDHSIIEEKLSRGEITQAQARVHPDKNKITRCIGYGAEVEIDVFNYSLKAGDRLLLCSDGLWDELEDIEIAGILYAGKDVNDCAARLIANANIKGGRDNITCIIIDYGKFAKSHLSAGAPALPGKYTSLYQYAKLKNKLTALYLIISFLAVGIIVGGILVFWFNRDNLGIPTGPGGTNSNDTTIEENESSAGGDLKGNKSIDFTLKFELKQPETLTLNNNVLNQTFNKKDGLSDDIVIIDKIEKDGRAYIFLFDRGNKKLSYFNLKNPAEDLPKINMKDKDSNYQIKDIDAIYYDDNKELIIYTNKLFYKFPFKLGPNYLDKILQDNTKEVELIEKKIDPEGKFDYFTYSPDDKENPIKTFSRIDENQLIADDNTNIAKFDEIVAGKILNLDQDRICLLALNGESYDFILYYPNKKTVTTVHLNSIIDEDIKNNKIKYFLLKENKGESIFTLMLAYENMKMKKVEIKMFEPIGSVCEIKTENSEVYQPGADKIKTFLADETIFADNIPNLNIVYFAGDSFKSFYLRKVQDNPDTLRSPNSTTTTTTATTTSSTSTTRGTSDSESSTSSSTTTTTTKPLSPAPAPGPGPGPQETTTTAAEATTTTHATTTTAETTTTTAEATTTTAEATTTTAEATTTTAATTTTTPTDPPTPTTDPIGGGVLP